MPRTRLRVRISGTIIKQCNKDFIIDHDEWMEEWQLMTEREGRYQAEDALEDPDDVSAFEVRNYDITLIEQTIDDNGFIDTKVVEKWVPYEESEED